ncbi:hypothetical protein [Aeromonas rivipollensis]
MSDIVIDSYKFSEPDSIGYEWSFYNHKRFGLRIKNACSVEYIFLRLLSGGVVIENGEDFFISDKNYFSNPISTATGSTSLLSNFIFIFGSGKLSPKDIVNVFNDNLSNSSFYKNLCLELAQLLLSENKRNFTKAFIHLYRLFESISFTFPLYYVKKEKTYNGAYSTLKSYFDDGGKSELAFCKSFIEKNVDSAILDATQPIVFTNNKSGNIKVLKKLKIGNHIDFSSSDPIIETKFVWDLIIESRNRYFHNLSGMGNSFTSGDIPEPDAFFQGLLPLGLHLLSSIYLSIIYHRL